MKAHFFEPPPGQRTGGLDAALQSLRTALMKSGISVDANLPGRAQPGHLAHFHGLWQPAHSRLSRACVSIGIPCLVSPHGMLEPWAWRHKWWKKWPYYQLVEKKHLARARCLLATGDAEARRLRRFFPRHCIESLPLGLTGTARPNYDQARAALGWRTDERVLLFVSRIHLKKGLDLLLHALIESELPEYFRLVIVGGGEPNYVQRLRDLTDQRSARLPSVNWMGEIWGAERWKFFQGADLFCLPSHSENFGLAVLEACQVGTPVLTTTATPWATALKKGVYICEPLIDSIQEQLRRFFLAPRWSAEDRTSLADWAWRNYAWDTLAPRYVALYESMAQP